MNNKKIIRLIPILLSLIIVIIFIIFCIDVGKDDKKGGSFKPNVLARKPEKFSDIEFISIRYNGGNDFITISKEDSYTIEYRGINEVGEAIINVDGSELKNTNKLSDSVKEYIMKKVVPELNKYENGSDDWFISINVESASTSLRGVKGTEPEWFKELLKQLEVDKYGNMSLKKQN